MAALSAKTAAPPSEAVAHSNQATPTPAVVSRTEVQHADDAVAPAAQPADPPNPSADAMDAGGLTAGVDVTSGTADAVVSMAGASVAAGEDSACELGSDAVVGQPRVAMLSRRGDAPAATTEVELAAGGKQPNPDKPPQQQSRTSGQHKRGKMPNPNKPPQPSRTSKQHSSFLRTEEEAQAAQTAQAAQRTERQKKRASAADAARQSAVHSAPAPAHADRHAPATRANRSETICNPTNILPTANEQTSSAPGDRPINDTVPSSPVSCDRRAAAVPTQDMAAQAPAAGDDAAAPLPMPAVLSGFMRPAVWDSLPRNEQQTMIDNEPRLHQQSLQRSRAALTSL